LISPGGAPDGPDYGLALTSGTETIALAHDVACGPKECLVVWQSSSGAGGQNVHGVRISGSNLKLKGKAVLPLSVAVFDELEPRIAWNGHEYVLAWLVAGSVPGTFEIRGERVSAKGKVLKEDAGGRFLAVTARYPYNGWLSSPPMGPAVLSYERFDDSPQVIGYKAFLRTFGN
jgi:hypothetical protein